MSEANIYTKCCKPCGGGKCSKSVRDVIPWMIKKNSTLNLKQKVCDSCRRKLSALNDCSIVENSSDEHDSVVDTVDTLSDVESEDENCNAKRMKHDLPYIEKETAINLLNKFLAEVGEPLIDNKRLTQKKYCQTKVASICNILKSSIFCGHPSQSEMAEDTGKVVLDQLKQKFRSSSKRSEKTLILTLVPQQWSILKTKSEFEGMSFEYPLSTRLFCPLVLSIVWFVSVSTLACRRNVTGIYIKKIR